MLRLMTHVSVFIESEKKNRASLKGYPISLFIVEWQNNIYFYQSKIFLREITCTISHWTIKQSTELNVHFIIETFINKQIIFCSEIYVFLSGNENDAREHNWQV